MPDVSLYILAIFAGPLAGVINTLAGSGSLVTLPMLMLLGLPATVANGTNRVGVAVQNIVGLATLKSRGALHIDGWVWFVVPVVVGAALGSFVAVDVEDVWLERAIGALMAVMLVVIVLDPKKWLKKREEVVWSRPTLILLICFVGIGFYGGFIQAGVGILLLVGLVVGAGYDAVSANGIKLLLNLIFTTVALGVFVWNDQVDWAFGGLMAVGQSLGAWGAARFAADREDAGKWIRRLLIVIVAAATIRFLVF
jgi:uncharacterized membrane protein YfcA